MTPIQPAYRRLPGARRSLFRKATLWLSNDHILAVDSHRFSEEYKRYYFKDIQAIMVTQRNARVSGSIDLAVLIVLAALGATAWQLQSRGAGFLVGLIVIGYAIHKLLGPQCTCHLMTAVSRDRLPSLRRVRTASKALRMIQPLVEQAQRGNAA